MPHRAVSIANEFLQLPGAAETLTQMALQKLVYISHGWNSVINSQPLVSDDVEAWDYGPVYKDLYDHTKFFGKEPLKRLITPDDAELARFFLKKRGEPREPYRAVLAPREKQVIEHVWKRYGSLSAIKLSELTHQRGTPWFRTYTEQGRNSVIEQALIVEHYQQLAERATAAARA